MAQPSLTKEALTQLLGPLGSADAAFSAQFPGEPVARQPIHTVYGGAHLFTAETPAKLGVLARKSLESYAPTFVAFARALGLPGASTLPDDEEVREALVRQLTTDPAGVKATRQTAWLAHTLFSRVERKLHHEPVEDLRIDFEDGFGLRGDTEEDHHAERAALELARGLAGGTLPPFIGLRVKPLTSELAPRALRTLDLFLTTLCRATQGALPPGFVVTLPKVQHPAQVEALERALTTLERALGLPPRAVKVELMVELTQTLVAPDGRFALPGLVAAAGGRCRGAHFGSYDYTASCNITSSDQSMLHPACDFARHVMQVSLSRTGVFLSDGATNVLPLPVHRAKPGETLSDQQLDENRRAVHGAWRLARTHIRDSLTRGFFQGWDLHPAQLPVRYATTYAYFFEALEPMAARLKNFVSEATHATTVGSVFDDAATGQGLLNFFARALSCGALDEAEATAATGLTAEELHGRSFADILARRATHRRP